MLVISKLKIDLMDQSSLLYRQLGALSQPEQSQLAFAQIETFVMDHLKNLLLTEMKSVLVPFDGKPLVNLLEKFQFQVRASRKYDRIQHNKDQPPNIAKEMLQHPIPEKTFRLESGLALSGKISRNLRKKSASLLNLFSAGDDDFRYRYCSDVISQISPTILAKELYAALIEKTSYDYEKFTSQECVLEQKCTDPDD